MREATERRLQETAVYDANFDGEVDDKDVQIFTDIIQAVRGGEILAITDYLKRDTTKDGRVTKADVDVIWQTLKGIVDLSIPKDGYADYGSIVITTTNAQGQSSSKPATGEDMKVQNDLI
jgi:hypothetical protein